MQNFSINFSHPWLLLLLIPAVLFTLIPYFKLSKRYRRTRNRVVSITLHLLVMLFAITLLAGILFTYTVPNKENEIIFLVDVSDTEEEVAQNRDEFLELALDYGRNENFNIGVVTFGFDQVYAVPLTTEVDGIFDEYLSAELPDTSATDIAAALTYTKSLFNYPETGKIVLITDGKETDQNANSIIRTVAALGIRVDTVNIASSYEGQDVQIIGVEFPDYYLNVDEEFTIKVTLQKNCDEQISTKINFSDNGTQNSENEQEVTLSNTTQTISFKYSFADAGLHEVCFELISNGGALEENDTYTSYFYLDVFTDILILESEKGESQALVDLLESDNEAIVEPYNITVMNIMTDDIPVQVDQLRLYDEVILNNVSYEQMPNGFDNILDSYVKDYGGGLFTVGGENAYNEEDIKQSRAYKNMLPVDVIDYTPPVGLIVIIDKSGSMSGTDAFGYNKIQLAREAGAACLEALTERDYMGILTLDSAQEVILELTSCSDDQTIRAAFNNVGDASGSTVVTDAIDQAVLMLRNEKRVDKRHIIIISDFGIPSSEREKYLSQATSYSEGEQPVTFSTVGINITATSEYGNIAKEIAEAGKGMDIYATSTAELIAGLEEDLYSPSIKEIVPEPFYPTINNILSPLLAGIERSSTENEDGTVSYSNRMTVQLGGFYGVKKKNAAEVVLSGNYDVPIYAQWDYGKGRVGSFMCDLSGGDWSAEFMNDENGKRFIINLVKNLMPTENIRPKEISAELKEDNYTNTINIYTSLGEDEYVKGEIYDTSTGGLLASMNSLDAADNNVCYVTSILSAENNYSRCGFVIKKAGVYKIVLTKCDKDGNIIGDPLEMYKTFSYSEEYDTALEATVTDLSSSIENLANRGNGVYIEELDNPYQIYEDFVTRIKKTFDPRFLFMILAIVLFLLDIAARKFKFKWPHEIYREHKEKKELKK